MMEVMMENMRLLAGVLFWAGVDVFLIVAWLVVVIELVLAVVKGVRRG